MKKKIEKYHVENKEEAKKQTLKRNPSFFCVCLSLPRRREDWTKEEYTHTQRTDENDRLSVRRLRHNTVPVFPEHQHAKRSESVEARYPFDFVVVEVQHLEHPEGGQRIDPADQVVLEGNELDVFAALERRHARQAAPDDEQQHKVILVKCTV